jgi:hypothetical protein
MFTYKWYVGISIQRRKDQMPWIIFCGIAVLSYPVCEAFAADQMAGIFQPVGLLRILFVRIFARFWDCE